MKYTYGMGTMEQCSRSWLDMEARPTGGASTRSPPGGAGEAKQKEQYFRGNVHLSGIGDRAPEDHNLDG